MRVYEAREFHVASVPRAVSAVVVANVIVVIAIAARQQREIIDA